jgi:glycosyltransferase involved in cell wall biosynthesis
MKPTLSLVLPLYRPPQGSWVTTLLAHLQAFQAAIPAYRILPILVDDGSGPGYLSEADLQYLEEYWPTYRLVQYTPNRGKGYAVRAGMAAAEGEYALFTDADFPYTAASMAAIVRQLERGADVALGVRNAQYYGQIRPARRRLSKLHAWLIRRLLRIPIADTQCGLKGFGPRGRQLLLQTRIERFLFDLEFVCRAYHQSALCVRTQPVALRPNIELSAIGLAILQQEAGNFLRILGWRLMGQI